MKKKSLADFLPFYLTLPNMDNTTRMNTVWVFGQPELTHATGSAGVIRNLLSSYIDTLLLQSLF
jgi:hypothetical protein